MIFSQIMTLQYLVLIPGQIPIGRISPDQQIWFLTNKSSSDEQAEFPTNRIMSCKGELPTKGNSTAAVSGTNPTWLAILSVMCHCPLGNWQYQGTASYYHKGASSPGPQERNKYIYIYKITQLATDSLHSLKCQTDAFYSQFTDLQNLTQNIQLQNFKWLD